MSAPSAGERVYRIFLCLYPAAFRREYREPLAQAFRDELRDAGTRAKRCRLWANTAIDLARTIPTQHLEKARGEHMSKTALTAYLFWLACCAFLARFELHTDDTGIEAGLLLLFSFALGCFYPRRAWLWAMLGLSIPAAELIWGHAQFPTQGSQLLVAGFVLGVGAMGSFLGAFLRKALSGSAAG